MGGTYESPMPPVAVVTGPYVIDEAGARGVLTSLAPPHGAVTPLATEE